MFDPPRNPQPVTCYRIRRIRLGSALKVGLLLGWLLALGPALLFAWLALEAMRRVDAALVGVRPMEISVLGQKLATIDPIAIAGQAENVQHVHGWVADAAGTFLALGGVLLLAGTVLVLLSVLLFCGGYNLLARLSGGLEVDLMPRAD
jgi:hypothetical protein